ncbi:MAG: NUDIX domain-containing protein [Gammaproteobacteria bacterium]|nr:NUDIX domain-containing protein [Gammaproteobacteria bacterium]
MRHPSEPSGGTSLASAQQNRTQGRTPPRIRKAATVLVVRQAAADIEVFMVQRPARGVFPDLHVFPGGKVDSLDSDLEHACAGLDDRDASRRLMMARGGLRYWVTAIRECFEESGVLLAYRSGTLFEPADDAESERFDGYQDALGAGETTLGEIARREGLELATDRVAYFSHWITPETAPARFDTRFFVAVMPPRQSAFGHQHETVGGEWVTPTAALSRFDADEWQMIFPTLTTLRMAAPFRSVEDLLGAVRAGAHRIEITGELHRQGMQYS